MTDLTYHELETFGDLIRDEERGLILEKGKRILTFRVATFQALEEHLREMAGAAVARTILHQLGNQIGHTGLQYSKVEVAQKGMAGALDSVVRARGWGRIASLTKTGDKIFVASVRDCPLCYDRKAKEPVCDIMRGIIDGWVEAFMGKKAQLSVERECAAVQGKQYCLFEVTL